LGPVVSVDASYRAVNDALVGRADELAVIHGFLERAACDGETLHLVGEPGVGKTALLEVAADRAAALGSRVLRCAGVEFEAEIPFAGLHQTLLPLHREFVNLASAHRDALNVVLGFGDGPAPDRLMLLNAVMGILDQAAKTQPVLLIVDDLPWVDRATAGILGSVARRMSGRPVGFLAASRTGEESFFERSGIAEIELGPLDETSADQLMCSRYPKLAPQVRERLLAEAQGNPLAVLELPTVLSGPQRAALDVLPPLLPLSRKLQALFRARVGALSELTRRLLLLMALDGSGDVRVLDAQRDRKRALEALAAAEGARLARLDEITHRLVFRHPMIRSAVFELSTVADRREAHSSLARLWADQPDRHIWHLAEATLGSDEHVATLLEHAGQRVLQRGDGVGAVRVLIRAAELSPSRTQRARRLAVAAYVGASVGGELRRAKALLAGVRRADPGLSGSVEAAVATSYVLMHGDGDVDAAHRLLVGAIETTEARGVAERAIEEALRTLAMASYYAGRAEPWESFARVLRCVDGEQAERARFRGELVGDPVHSSRAALEWLDVEIARLTLELDPSKILPTAGMATNVDRLPACREALQRLVAQEPEGGALTGYAQMMLGLESWRSGRWVEAEELANRAEALATAQSHALLAWHVRAIKAFVLAASGEESEARSIAERMIQWAVPRGVRAVQAEALYVLTLIALVDGDFEDAYHRAIAISPAGVLAPYRPHAMHVMVDLVEAAVRTGRYAEARAHAVTIKDADVAAVSPRQALLAGGAAAIASPGMVDFELFEAALALPDVDRWPFDLARIQLAYGERLRRARSMTEARRHLTTAAEIFDRLGAGRWALRASNELRATGQTRSHGDERYRDALTAQELEIATLASTGFTNKQIGLQLYLSHRTVGAHLYRIFPKLGISSRAALSDALASLPEEQSPASNGERPATAI
jgi:DNA-binding CsgD family transcriptional regulator